MIQDLPIVFDTSIVPFEKQMVALISNCLSAEQVNCPVTHTFSEGQYIREASMPAGSFIIGHVHKQEHMNVLHQGKLIVYNSDGTQDTLTAPLMFMAQPGRKVALILEDVIWYNIYNTDETDVEKLEEMFLDKEASPKLLPNKEDDYFIQESRNDFTDVCSLLGFSEELVREASENTTDLAPFPFGQYRVEVKDSSIEGKGLFACGNISKGEVFAPMRIAGKRTPAGRFTNHGVLPNAIIVRDSANDIYLEALCDIKGGDYGSEITIDYYHTFINSRE